MTELISRQGTTNINKIISSRYIIINTNQAKIYNYLINHSRIKNKKFPSIVNINQDLGYHPNSRFAKSTIKHFISLGVAEQENELSGKPITIPRTWKLKESLKGKFNKIVYMTNSPTTSINLLRFNKGENSFLIKLINSGTEGIVVSNRTNLKLRVFLRDKLQSSIELLTPLDKIPYGINLQLNSIFRTYLNYEISSDTASGKILTGTRYVLNEYLRINQGFTKSYFDRELRKIILGYANKRGREGFTIRNFINEHVNNNYSTVLSQIKRLVTSCQLYMPVKFRLISNKPATIFDPDQFDPVYFKKARFQTKYTLLPLIIEFVQKNGEINYNNIIILNDILGLSNRLSKDYLSKIITELVNDGLLIQSIIPNGRHPIKTIKLTEENIFIVPIKIPHKRLMNNIFHEIKSERSLREILISLRKTGKMGDYFANMRIGSSILNPWAFTILTDFTKTITISLNNHKQKDLHFNWFQSWSQKLIKSNPIIKKLNTILIESGINNGIWDGIIAFRAWKNFLEKKLRILEPNGSLKLKILRKRNFSDKLNFNNQLNYTNFQKMYVEWTRFQEELVSISLDNEKALLKMGIIHCPATSYNELRLNLNKLNTKLKSLDLIDKILILLGRENNTQNSVINIFENWLNYAIDFKTERLAIDINGIPDKYDFTTYVRYVNPKLYLEVFSGVNKQLTKSIERILFLNYMVMTKRISLIDERNGQSLLEDDGILLRNISNELIGKIILENASENPYQVNNLIYLLKIYKGKYQNLNRNQTVKMLKTLINHSNEMDDEDSNSILRLLDIELEANYSSNLTNYPKEIGLKTSRKLIDIAVLELGFQFDTINSLLMNGSNVATGVRSVADKIIFSKKTNNCIHIEGKQYFEPGKSSVHEISEEQLRFAEKSIRLGDLIDKRKLVSITSNGIWGYLNPYDIKINKIIDEKDRRLKYRYTRKIAKYLLEGEGNHFSILSSIGFLFEGHNVFLTTSSRNKILSPNKIIQEEVTNNSLLLKLENAFNHQTQGIVFYNKGSLILLREYLKSILNINIPLKKSKIDQFANLLKIMGFKENGFASIKENLSKARNTSDKLAKETALKQVHTDIMKFLNNFSIFLEKSLFAEEIDDLIKS